MKRWILVLTAAVCFNSPAQASYIDSYTQKVEHGWKEWNVKMKIFQKNIEKAGRKSRVELDYQVDGIRQGINAVQRSFTGLKQPSQSIWESLPKSIEEAVRAVKQYYKEMPSLIEKSTDKEDNP